MKRHQLLVVIGILLFFYFFNLQLIKGQIDPNSNEFIEAIDSMFLDKSDLNAPGASVIIMQGESVLLTKNYGSANLVFGLPFDENTVFPLEGFTEQLIVFSILQLEKKKKINLNNSVNKYLPELGFPDRVSLFHLLNHSSAYPMISSLRLIAGWNYSDPFTHNDFLELTKKVAPELNPDKEFIHNHGGIKILMMIVEKVSGNSFSEYASENIFSPLNMNNTSVKNKGYRDTKNSSVGYTRSDIGYIQVVPTPFEIICPDTYSTQLDFQKWMANVQSKNFNGDIIRKMDQALTINGKLQERTYGSYCIGQYQYRKYLEQDEFFMREIGNGYSWMWLRLSQAKLSIMVIGNLDVYVGPKVNGIADLLAYYNPPIASNNNEAVSSPLELSEKEMQLCTGIYWNEEYMYTTKISIKDGGLYHSDNDNGFNFLLTPKTKTLFETPFGGTVEFTNVGGNQKRMRNIIPNGRVFDSQQYDVPALKEIDQLKYVGVYKSDVLNAFYQVVLENNKLKIKRSRKPDLELTPIGTNKFRTSEIDFRLIEFKGKVDGTMQKMDVSNPALKNVSFRKF